MELLIHTFVTLFVVIDPIGIAPIFVALVHGNSVAYQRRMALNSIFVAALILFAFFFIGDFLLRVLGITIEAFRVAGGILLFLLAIDMIFARQSGLRSTTAREQHEAELKEDISVFPLAFPLIAGPGALTTVLLMSTVETNVALVSGMLAVLAGVLLLTLLFLLFSSKIKKILGETGANVLSRLFGLILAALAVQYVFDGVKSGLLS